MGHGGQAASWTASRNPGGSPGTTEPTGVDYATWATTRTPSLGHQLLGTITTSTASGGQFHAAAAPAAAASTS